LGAQLLQVSARYSSGCRQLVDRFRQGRVRQAVINIAPAALGCYQVDITQRHQVLRNGRLAQTQSGFQVANAGLPLSQDQHNLNARRLAQQVKDFGQITGYIRRHEYILADFFKSVEIYPTFLAAATIF
jgi:hypothetical protein